MATPLVGNRDELKTAIQSYLNGNPDGYVPIGQWDVSQVTNMNGLFNGYSTFNEDIGDWDVSNVTEMAQMFVGCADFNQDISGWDVSNVDRMSGMFMNCAAFNQDISGWDVSKVTNMSFMFSYCVSFNQDISGWETTMVVSFVAMFYQATAFQANQNLDAQSSPYRYWTITPDAYYAENPEQAIDSMFLPNGPSVTLDFFNQPRPSAQSGGDPYVYPLAGPPVKLPNCSATYRLYQDERTVINAEVRAASPAIQAEILLAATDVGAGLEPISAEAYFFSCIHVAQRCDGPAGTWEHVTVDLENRSTTGSTGGLQVGDPQLVLQPDQAYDQGGRSHVCIPIRWGRGAGRRELCVHFSRNPQVRNGLSLRGPGLERGTGLLVRNFRPKLFDIPTLKSTTPVRISARCRRSLTQRAIQGPAECTLTVQC